MLRCISVTSYGSSLGSAQESCVYKVSYVSSEDILWAVVTAKLLCFFIALALHACMLTFLPFQRSNSHSSLFFHFSATTRATTRWLALVLHACMLTLLPLQRNDSMTRLVRPSFDALHPIDPRQNLVVQLWLGVKHRALWSKMADAFAIAIDDSQIIVYTVTRHYNHHPWLVRTRD